MILPNSARESAEACARQLLDRRGVSPSCGFLDQYDPLINVPAPQHEVFEQHLRLGAEMPDLLLLGAEAYRQRVLQLPLIDRVYVQALPVRILPRIAVTLAFLTQAYIWQDRRHPRTVLPAQLALPMYAVGQALDVAPLLIYQFYTLANWKRRNPDGPIVIENVAMIQNFNSAQTKERRASEEWFVAVHIEIEATAGALIEAAFILDAALVQGDTELVADCLVRITTTLAAMEKILARMNEGCDPDIYYEHVRPYLFGWFNVPGGVVYEGVPELFGGGQLFRGQTGAQSSIAPLCDALLCIPHYDPKFSSHLETMLRHHTPWNHRDLVAQFTHSFAARAIRWSALLETDDTINELYRSARHALAQFRRQHYDHAITYIAKPARREHEALHGSGEVIIPGTGGSDLIRSLKLHIEETIHPAERATVMEGYEAHWKELYHSS